MDLKSLDLVRGAAFDTIQFSPSELRQVLSAYSEGVLRKNWRDYAILSDSNQTLFAVVDSAGGDMPRILFAIARIHVPKKAPLYKVFEGEKPIMQSASFLAALTQFREIRCDKRGWKPYTV